MQIYIADNRIRFKYKKYDNPSQISSSTDFRTDVGLWFTEGNIHLVRTGERPPKYPNCVGVLRNFESTSTWVNEWPFQLIILKGTSLEVNEYIRELN